MRNGSHKLWLCIATAAAGSVIAVPAASADVVEHDTDLTIFVDAPRDDGLFHGDVESGVRKCEVGRRVSVFKQRPGADRKLGSVRTTEPNRGGNHNWGVLVPNRRLNQDDRVYAKVTREVGDRFVCRADRSSTLTWPLP